MNVEYIPVGQLKPYEKNARKHAEYDVGQIAESIERYGFNDPIGIWGKDNIYEIAAEYGVEVDK